jgi:hypothetical protein
VARGKRLPTRLLAWPVGSLPQHAVPRKASGRVVVLEREWRLSGHPFCCAGCVEVTALREPVCLVCREGGVGPGVSKISYHQRPHELRLAISSEAEARFPILAAKRLALDKLKVRDVPIGQVQKIESVIDKMHFALAACGRLRLCEAWQPRVDAAKLAVQVGALTFSFASAAMAPGYLAVQSRPVSKKSGRRRSKRRYGPLKRNIVSDSPYDKR